jgi:hypothetical protein
MHLAHDDEQRQFCAYKRHPNQGAPLRAARDEPGAHLARYQPDRRPVRAAAGRSACNEDLCGIGCSEVSWLSVFLFFPYGNYLLSPRFMTVAAQLNPEDVDESEVVEEPLQEKKQGVF